MCNQVSIMLYYYSKIMLVWFSGVSSLLATTEFKTLHVIY